MRFITLLYHDVVPAGHPEASGFPGGDSSIYKLGIDHFRCHLNAIDSVADQSQILLTFDDGGVSAHQYIADLLEAKGWRGHFFVTTDWIGRPAFLNSGQIRDLHRRGHQIGSHSCSHPARLSYCPRGEILREWSESVAVLADVIGEPVRLASAPGGYYSRTVAETAAEAGIQTLFTSEPQTSTEIISGCLVRGRYTIQRGTSARTAAAIASGRILPRYGQYVYWNLKKAAKVAGGAHWLRARKWILAR